MFAAGTARSHSARVGPVNIYTLKSVYVRMLCCTYVISACVLCVCVFVCVCVCIIYICVCVCVVSCLV